MSARPHRWAPDAAGGGPLTGQTWTGTHPGPVDATTGCPSAPVKEHTRSYR